MTTNSALLLLVLGTAASSGLLQAAQVVQSPFPPRQYPDGRPAAQYRLNATDQGRVLMHGGGPRQCDELGAREAIVFQHRGTYYLHYDGAGPTGWLACLATSKDLVQWTKHGPAIELGQPGDNDAGTASSPWVYFDGKTWHMFYVGSVSTTPPPDRIPACPYMTLKATSRSPMGPWLKQTNVVPFHPRPNSYYADTASPGQIVRHGHDYLMFFSAASGTPMKRTLSIARTRDLNGSWQLDPEPALPLTEQIENSALYFEKRNRTWFLFTNHVGLDSHGEYTDALWVYWSKDINRWEPNHKAVALDGQNCTWSSDCIGMPSVVQVGKRLAILYDAPGRKSVSHMRRDVGLAWLDLPLSAPER
jgi:predicted GH43/DUF377 family glycosyl hydrolase